MRSIKERKSWIAALAIVALFSACKGESPTAPPTGGGTPPGGTTPPVGVTLTVTVSNSDPLIDSSVVITATATLNGQAVPNGTAVEFETTGGTFDANADVKATVKTTTNGVATATLTSSDVGPVQVRATVNNVAKVVSITFRETPIVTPPPSTAPTISSVSPTVGRPAGGQSIRITGSNFKSPVRVFFSTGAGLSPVEAFVVSSTSTTIDVLTPAFNVGAGQQFVSDVIVITEAGTTAEQRVTSTGAFTFRNEVLTPRISTATPNSGPVTGGTRITIIGDGFQAPVQVLFGSAEARVITVNFAEIIVESPAARDTAPDGSGAVTGPVTITVRNINSSTSTTLTDGFRYINAVQITAFHPASGPATGGTDVVIEGTGFVSPVSVSIGGRAAQVLSVSGTRLLARTGALPSPCGSDSGAVQVTNVVNGDTDSSQSSFEYVAVQPRIIEVVDGNGGLLVPGDPILVTVRDPGVGPTGLADIRFSINDRAVFPSPSTITQGAGTTTFSVAVPTSGFTFGTESCQTSTLQPGTRLAPTSATLTFSNITTECTDILAGGLTVDPPAPNTCLAAPQASVTTPSGGSCATPGTASVSGVGFPTQTQASIVISNATESQPLNITAVAISGANASEFTISPTTASNIAAGGSQTFTLTFTPTTAGAKTATVTFTTNSPTAPTLTVCVQATAAP